MNDNISSLKETSAGSWTAKYAGNYGNYTIKIKMNGKKMNSFSCTCPSDYYPCKHIDIIRNAIEKDITKNKHKRTEKAISVEEIIKTVSHKELIGFVVRQAKYDTELTNTFLLEFMNKKPKENAKQYGLILREALSRIVIDEEDFYEYQYNGIEIDILDEWFEKIRECISKKQIGEAIAICKACIEEYAEWLQEEKEFENDYLDDAYQEEPFELLKDIAAKQDKNKNDLYEYCLSEIKKPKYEGTYMLKGFCNLLLHLVRTDQETKEIIALFDSQLEKIKDKSSYEAKNIVERKIALYKKMKQYKLADNLVTENLQIESFRMQLVEKYIKANKYQNAKGLIEEFLSAHPNHNFNFHQTWLKLLLTIAQKQSDHSEIRRISYLFVQNYFQEEYYRIYKSSFVPDEWEAELKKLINYYQQNDKWFSNSVADVLKEEKDTLALMNYVKQFLSVDSLERYHSVFAKAYPETTLKLFGKALDQYIEKNTGRNTYENLVTLFHKIKRIPGGPLFIKTTINRYQQTYKNRKAMMEILAKVKL